MPRTFPQPAGPPAAPQWPAWATHAPPPRPTGPGPPVAHVGPRAQTPAPPAPLSPASPQSPTNSFGSASTWWQPGAAGAAFPGSPAAATLGRSLPPTPPPPAIPDSGPVAVLYSDEARRPRFLFRRKDRVDAQLRDLDADVAKAADVKYSKDFLSKHSNYVMAREGRRGDFRGSEGQWIYYNKVNARMLAFAHLNPDLVKEMDKPELTELADAFLKATGEAPPQGPRRRRAKSAGIGPRGGPAGGAGGAGKRGRKSRRTSTDEGSLPDVERSESTPAVEAPFPGAREERPWYLSGRLGFVGGNFVVLPGSGHTL
ncbi:hypothetical protein DFJ74DRAFT_441194 [Hyaloraphidium curvatum]|nr:hypothetical protein DFJ74DRAFT_441194 [Hyaloraphidium curvatum]